MKTYEVRNLHYRVNQDGAKEYFADFVDESGSSHSVQLTEHPTFVDAYFYDDNSISPIEEITPERNRLSEYRNGDKVKLEIKIVDTDSQIIINK